jgi:hypothetical protein
MSLTMRSLSEDDGATPGACRELGKNSNEVLRSTCTAMGLLRQLKWTKLIFTGPAPWQILLIMKWTDQARCDRRTKSQSSKHRA